LVSRAVEEAGISTVTLTIIPEVTKKNGVPRIVHSPYSFGSPCGRPGDVEGQLHVIREALKFLQEANTPGELLTLSRR